VGDVGGRLEYSGGPFPWQRRAHASHSEAATEESRGGVDVGSDAIDPDDVSRVWPIIGIRYKAGPHWIIAHVVPLLPVALVTPQNMIETSALPDWISAWAAHNTLRETLFQKADPAS